MQGQKQKLREEQFDSKSSLDISPITPIQAFKLKRPISSLKRISTTPYSVKDSQTFLSEGQGRPYTAPNFGILSKLYWKRMDKTERLDKNNFLTSYERDFKEKPMHPEDTKDR